MTAIIYSDAQVASVWPYGQARVLTNVQHEIEDPPMEWEDNLRFVERDEAENRQYQDGVNEVWRPSHDVPTVDTNIFTAVNNKLTPFSFPARLRSYELYDGAGVEVHLVGYRDDGAYHQMVGHHRRGGVNQAWTSLTLHGSDLVDAYRAHSPDYIDHWLFMHARGLAFDDMRARRSAAALSRRQLNGNNGSWTNSDDVAPTLLLAPPALSRQSGTGLGDSTLNGSHGEYTNSDDVPSTPEENGTWVWTALAPPQVPPPALPVPVAPQHGLAPPPQRVRADTPAVDVVVAGKLRIGFDRLLFAADRHDNEFGSREWPDMLLAASWFLGEEPIMVFNPYPDVWHAIFRGRFDLDLDSRRHDGDVEWHYHESISRTDPFPTRGSLPFLESYRSAATYTRDVGGRAGVANLMRLSGPRGGLDSALNGANGEVTGKDDVKIRGSKSAAGPRPVQKGKQAIGSSKALARKIAKAARGAVLDVAGQAGSMGSAYLGAPPSVQRYADKMTRGMVDSIMRAIGWGDYTISSHNFQKINSNALVKGAGNGNIDFGTDSTRIKTREKVCGLYSNALSAGSPVFYAFTIQPADATLFRKMSQTAVTYAMYRIRGLIFTFISQEGVATTGSLGEITWGLSYNPDSPAPTTLEGMENLDMVFRSTLTDNCAYGVECKIGTRSRDVQFVRRPGITASSAADYDFATLYVCINPGATIATNQLIGTLYAAMDVEFYKLQATNTRSGYFRVTRSGVSASAPFGTTTIAIVKSGVCNNFTMGGAGTSAILTRAPEGTSYRARILWTGGTSATLAYPVPTVTNASNLAICSAGTSPYGYYPSSGSASTTAIMEFGFTVTTGFNANAVLNLTTGSTIPATGATCELHIESLGTDVSVGTNI